jgi:hypothetical protein
MPNRIALDLHNPGTKSRAIVSVRPSETGGPGMAIPPAVAREPVGSLPPVRVRTPLTATGDGI